MDASYHRVDGWLAGYPKASPSMGGSCIPRSTTFIGENESVTFTKYSAMPHDARVIANFFLDYGAARDQSVTIMSLLKILFFAHAWHLGKTGLPLIGQPFEAWRYGPVSRVVYDQFKSSGERPITGRAKVLNVTTAQYETARWAELDEDTRRLLRNVFDYYSRFHPFRLSHLTHEKGGPWDIVWSEATRRAVPGMVISNDSIRDWFQQSRPLLGSVGDYGWYL